MYQLFDKEERIIQTKITIPFNIFDTSKIKENINDYLQKMPKHTKYGKINNIIKIENVSPMIVNNDAELETVLSIRVLVSNIKKGSILKDCIIKQSDSSIIICEYENTKISILPNIIDNGIMRYNYTTYKNNEKIDICILQESNLLMEDTTYAIGKPFYMFVMPDDKRLISVTSGNVSFDGGNIKKKNKTDKTDKTSIDRKEYSPYSDVIDKYKDAIEYEIETLIGKCKIDKVKLKDLLEFVKTKEYTNIYVYLPRTSFDYTFYVCTKEGKIAEQTYNLFINTLEKYIKYMKTFKHNEKEFILSKPIKNQDSIEMKKKYAELWESTFTE